MAKKSRYLEPRHHFILISILVVLLAISFLITSDGHTSAAPKVSPTPTVKISVVSPNGGENFHQGAANVIKWSGGYNYVAVGLATADSNTNYAIAWVDGNPPYSGPQTNGTTGHIIGFINTRVGGGYYLPNGSTTWDGLKVCNYHPNLDPDTWCKNVAPGTYKIFVWSENQDGSQYIGSGSGPSGKYTQKDTPGNWDLSDQPFTILSQ